MSSAKEIVSENPACCTPETTVQEAARMMIDHDCWEITGRGQSKKHEARGADTALQRALNSSEVDL